MRVELGFGCKVSRGKQLGPHTPEAVGEPSQVLKVLNTPLLIWGLLGSRTPPVPADGPQPELSSEQRSGQALAGPAGTSSRVFRVDSRCGAFVGLSARFPVRRMPS